jgi:hypothetical protein
MGASGSRSPSSPTPKTTRSCHCESGTDVPGNTEAREHPSPPLCFLPALCHRQAGGGRQRQRVGLTTRSIAGPERQRQRATQRRGERRPKATQSIALHLPREAATGATCRERHGDRRMEPCSAYHPLPRHRGWPARCGGLCTKEDGWLSGDGNRRGGGRRCRRLADRRGRGGCREARRARGHPDRRFPAGGGARGNRASRGPPSRGARRSNRRACLRMWLDGRAGMRCGQAPRGRADHCEKH